MDGGPRLHERPIEEITIVGDKNVRLHIENVVEETPEQLVLVGLVENDERSLELGLWRVLEILHRLADDFPE